MPIVDLNSETELLFQWGWLLVTKANALVFLLVVIVFLLGAFVSLPGERPAPSAADGSATAGADGGRSA